MSPLLQSLPPGSVTMVLELSGSLYNSSFFLYTLREKQPSSCSSCLLAVLGFDISQELRCCRCSQILVLNQAFSIVISINLLSYYLFSAYFPTSPLSSSFSPNTFPERFPHRVIPGPQASLPIITHSVLKCDEVCKLQKTKHVSKCSTLSKAAVFSSLGRYDAFGISCIFGAGHKCSICSNDYTIDTVHWCIHVIL